MIYLRNMPVKIRFFSRLGVYSRLMNWWHDSDERSLHDVQVNESESPIWEQ